AKRSATARAAAEAVVLRLPAEAFQRWIGDHIPAREYFAHFLSHASLQHFLKRFTALGALNASELSELVDALTVESFPAGASVVGEGGPGDALYIVQSGVGQVIQGTPEPRLLTQLAAGDVFGELSLLYNTPRRASVVAG